MQRGKASDIDEVAGRLPSNKQSWILSRCIAAPSASTLTGSGAESCFSGATVPTPETRKPSEFRTTTSYVFES